MGNAGFILQIVLFILSSIGGFLFWILKGLKTKISKEYEKKYLIRNILTSTAILSFCYFIFYSNKPQEKIHQSKPIEIKFTIKNGEFIKENGDSLFPKK